MVNNGIVVFISGRGSNLNAIINAVNDGVIKYPIAAVVSDRYCELSLIHISEPTRPY